MGAVGRYDTQKEIPAGTFLEQTSFAKVKKRSSFQNDIQKFFPFEFPFFENEISLTLQNVWDCCSRAFSEQNDVFRRHDVKTQRSGRARALATNSCSCYIGLGNKRKQDQ